MTTNPNAYEKIVPRAIPPGGAVVRPFEFAVRTLVDYDVNYLTDRVVSSVFVNGHPSGVYATMRIEESPTTPGDYANVLDQYGPDLERLVIDEFMGLGYRKELRAAQRQIEELQDRIDHLERPRWWHLRHQVGRLRAAVLSWVARKARNLAERVD